MAGLSASSRCHGLGVFRVRGASNGSKEGRDGGTHARPAGWPAPAPPRPALSSGMYCMNVDTVSLIALPVVCVAIAFLGSRILRWFNRVRDGLGQESVGE